MYGIQCIFKLVQLCLKCDVCIPDQRVTDLLETRTKCFVGTPLNIYRHVILSDLPETLKHLPHVSLNFCVYSTEVESFHSASEL